MKVEINELVAINKTRKEINQVALEDIEMYLDNKLVKIDDYIIEELSFTGLNTCDLIMYAIDIQLGNGKFLL